MAATYALEEFRMEKDLIFVVEESPEGGFQARALGDSIFTEADSYEELKMMVLDAVACHFTSPFPVTALLKSAQ